MNKFRIISVKFNLAVLIFTAFLFASPSCKKDNGKVEDKTETLPPIINNPDLTTAEKYATLIKEKTSLIKELKTNVTYKLYNGVEETHITYTNSADMPMAIFFLSVDLSKDGVSLEVATPNDGVNLNAKQSVPNMITYKNASHTSLEVIAAVNGDYWRVNDTEIDNTPLGQPYGLVYKKGIALKESTKNGAYYYFSIQQDGSAYFGTQGDASTATIKEGLGGRYLLVQNGVEKPDALGYNTNIEPRTAVGMLNPKNVVFLLVDGRIATHSQGLTMSELAKIFKAIGATNAVNMDGGGSTTLAVKDGSSYTVKNIPSDGAPRSVAAAWTVMGKKL